ncbi:MAG TPA: hypothetical protein PLV45_08535 [bacterium]|nr:hypothetical protein [bacterium]
MEHLGIGIIIIILSLLGLFIAFIFYSLLLHLAAGWVNIDDRRFSKALLSTLAGLMAFFSVGIFLSLLPFIGWAISFAAGIIIPVLITQAIFNTTFVKALSAELIRFAIVSLLSAIALLLVLILVGFEAVHQGAADLFQHYTQALHMRLF